MKKYYMVLDDPDVMDFPPSEGCDVIIKGGWEEKYLYTVLNPKTKKRERHYETFKGITIGVKFVSKRSGKLLGDYIHIPEVEIPGVIEALKAHVKDNEKPVILVDEVNVNANILEDKRMEGFDDGKDLILLMDKQKKRGLRSDETNRLKQIKLKYNIPTYGQDIQKD